MIVYDRKITIKIYIFSKKKTLAIIFYSSLSSYLSKKLFLQRISFYVRVISLQIFIIFVNVFSSQSLARYLSTSRYSISFKHNIFMQAISLWISPSKILITPIDMNMNKTLVNKHSFMIENIFISSNTTHLISGPLP